MIERRKIMRACLNILFHGIEKEIENIEEVFLRECVYKWLDVVAAGRRSLAEEVRWDI
ncbi:Uncharacterised protein [uncultured archaeon]|nr:Uncharacterised protein [uncultured archaeon]